MPVCFLAVVTYKEIKLPDLADGLRLPQTSGRFSIGANIFKEIFQVDMI